MLLQKTIFVKVGQAKHLLRNHSKLRYDLFELALNHEFLFRLLAHDFAELGYKQDERPE